MAKVTRTREAFHLFWDQERVVESERESPGWLQTWAGPGGPGVSPEETLCPSPPVEVLAPLLPPAGQAAVTDALGHTEGFC